MTLNYMEPTASPSKDTITSAAPVKKRRIRLTLLFASPSILLMAFSSSIIGCASLCSTHLSCHAFEIEDVDQRCKLLRKWCLNYDDDGQTMRTIFEAPPKHDDWSRLIIIGGKEDTVTNFKSTIEVIDLEDAKVCPSLPSLSQPIFYSGAEILGDKFLSIGGSNDFSIQSAEIQAYDPLYKNWTNFGTLPNPNSHFPTVKLEDHWILTLGGWEADAPSANTYQIFLNGSVSRGPDLPHTGYGIGATAIGKNYVFMVGAFTDNLRNAYILNWEQQTFEEQSPLTLNRRYAQCQPYRDKNNVLKILVVGGTTLSDPSGPTPADIFVWESKTWLPGPSLEDNHYHSRL
eukprot:TCALIF_07910-PA protein Name:"Protein of unknown function" AED:0.15 eAED:0.15 QI:0/0.33/0/0.5/0.66/0.5/4/0/344